MNDVDNLPSLGDALGTVDGARMYTEARRQYEALRKDSASRTSKDSAVGPLELQQFYASQFDRVTEHLDWEEKMKLLTICFAYKTRKQVLRFLDLVNPTSVKWLQPLKEVVKRAGRDTMFPAAPAPTPAPCLKTTRKQAQPNKSNRATSTKTSPTHGPRRTPAQQPSGEGKDPNTTLFPSYFIIPTLPLAFPVHYLSAWASHVALPKLTVESLLRQPVSYTLAASPHVKGILRTRIPSASPTAWEDAPSYHVEFFEYLLRGSSKLPGVYACDNAKGGVKDYPFDVGRRGYSLADMKKWVEVWRVKRRERLADKSARAERPKQADGSAWGRGKRKRVQRDDEHGGTQNGIKKRVKFAEKLIVFEAPLAGSTSAGYVASRAVPRSGDGKGIRNWGCGPVDWRKNVHGSGQHKSARKESGKTAGA